MNAHEIQNIRYSRYPHVSIYGNKKGKSNSICSIGRYSCTAKSPTWIQSINASRVCFIVIPRLSVQLRCQSHFCRIMLRINRVSYSWTSAILHDAYNLINAGLAVHKAARIARPGAIHTAILRRNKMRL